MGNPGVSLSIVLYTLVTKKRKLILSFLRGYVSDVAEIVSIELCVEMRFVWGGSQVR